MKTNIEFNDLLHHAYLHVRASDPPSSPNNFTTIVERQACFKVRQRNFIDVYNQSDLNQEPPPVSHVQATLKPAMSAIGAVGLFVGQPS